MSVAGFVVTTTSIQRDRRAQESRRAQVERVRTQGILSGARAYVAGLGNVLAGEPERSQRRFAQLQVGTASGLGLTDAFWVERVPASRRAAYERRLGAPITRVAAGGDVRPAPPAASYLPVTFRTTAGTAVIPRGADVSELPELANAINDVASVFAVTATPKVALGDRAGFFALERARFGRGAGSTGFLVVFIPQGWLTLSLEGDPRGFAVALEGRRLEGTLDSTPAAVASFRALGRGWTVGVARGRLSALDELLPWLALGWPWAFALIVALVTRAVTRRRRAEREAERIFDLAFDLLCVADTAGYFTRVNPAFERTLGYSSDELLSRPLLDFVHPDDRDPTRDSLAGLAGGQDVRRFENRYVRRDGSACWLEWSARPEEGVIYATARDVTDRRRAEQELRAAKRQLELSRDELSLLAAEQAALGRVATLVAHGASPTAVFDAVAVELGHLLEADATRVMRYEAEDRVTVMASDGKAVELPTGARLTIEGDNVPAAVWRQRTAVRFDTFEHASGSLAATLREMGIHAAVGAPILVEGKLWGVTVAVWREAASLPPQTEARMAQFTDLVVTAIANAESREQLQASRARVVAASDETRRRIERNLHDGTQQRLVALALALRAAEDRVGPEQHELQAELDRTADGLVSVVEDLQEISRGLHPAILSRGGLAAALKTLARRSPVPVELDLEIERRLPEPIEVAAYYVVSEALANAAKHAEASVVWVNVRVDDARMTLTVRDDGVGSADPSCGSGLTGLSDRVQALGGTIEIDSPPGSGTTIRVRLPIAQASAIAAH